MLPLHRALQEDSKTSRFAILRNFHELILNFKDHSKLLQTSPYSTIPLSHWHRRQPPGLFQIQARGPGRRVGASAKQNAAGRALHGAGDRLCTAAPGKTGEGAGGGRKGLFCNFQNLQGPNCKQAVTFKPGLNWKSAQHESCSIFQDLQLSCCAKIYLIKG